MPRAVLSGLAGVALWLIRHVPWRARRGMAMAIGRRVARAQRKRHHAAHVNLTLAFGDRYSDAEKQRIAEQSFGHFIRCMLDAAALIPTLNARTWHNVVRVPVADIARLNGHFARGNGVLVMFSHYGNWELMGAAMPFICRHPVHVVAKRQAGWSNPLIEGFRTLTGNKVIYKEGAVRATLKALKANELVGLSIDQNFSQGIFVPFFGVPAGTVDTLAALARASGAPIVPLVCTPDGDGAYTGRLLPAVEPVRTDDKDADIHAITLACFKVLEETIRQRPEFWLWGHKRWKSRPPDERPRRDFYGHSHQPPA
ncbi:MAG: hypothetical protein HZA24_09950 [Nitrospirae bacterium]|nr:hypothetical protein [Nitrospirota bacterium]